MGREAAEDPRDYSASAFRVLVKLEPKNRCGGCREMESCSYNGSSHLILNINPAVVS